MVTYDESLLQAEQEKIERFIQKSASAIMPPTRTTKTAISPI